MNEDMISSVEDEIFEIRSKIAEKKRILKELGAEAEKHVKERDAIHERIREIKSRNAEALEKIKALRGEVASFREKLKNLTLEIQRRRGESQQIIEQLETTRTEGMNAQQISRRIAELEQRIETGPIRPEDEKRFYEEIRRLNKLLAEVKKREELSGRLRSVKNESAALRGDAQSIREALSTKVEEMGKLREILKAVRESINDLKPEADRHHNAFLETKKKMQVVEAEIILLSSRLYELQDLVRKQKEEQARTKENAIRERVRSQAMQKITMGGKLSFEEMKLLVEDESAWSMIAKGSNNSKRV
ncbi:MAG: hypothetical protein QW756_05070 [Nitrososphaerota archaeon]